MKLQKSRSFSVSLGSTVYPRRGIYPQKPANLSTGGSKEDQEDKNLSYFLNCEVKGRVQPQLGSSLEGILSEQNRKRW
ncbi:hypothetical protein JOB18_042099 [Solea senegalensis]|uniref:Uncharacterized protein n=1 Tax=Solea senegalensis TaxID=28829 RepID=A0AAV6S072_SOLSE|nr:hypothetical protein JOB18_042099 [Solea senegalensis]